MLIQAALPDGGAEPLIHHHVNASGKVKSTDHISLLSHSLAQKLEATNPEQVHALTQRLQFMHWHWCKLFKATINRETPLNKCFPYSALLTRKQRWAIASTAILVGSFFSVLLFRVDCVTTEPKPQSCVPVPLWQKFISWDVVFSSLWGVVLSVPVPLLLISLFKKQVMHQKMSDAHKHWHIKIALCKERLAWLLVVLIQTWCAFFMFQFVRSYKWEVVEAWLLATFWSVVHRLITAPGIRVIWVLCVLTFSRTFSALDCCVAYTTASIFSDHVPIVADAPGDSDDDSIIEDDGGDDDYIGDDGGDDGGDGGMDFVG